MNLLVVMIVFQLDFALRRHEHKGFLHLQHFHYIEKNVPTNVALNLFSHCNQSIMNTSPNS